MARVAALLLGTGLLLCGEAQAQEAPRGSRVQMPGIQQPRKTGRQMRALLEQDPDAPQPRVVLGMSLGAQGKCALALEHLATARADGRAWTGEAALAEGECLRRAGDLAGAEAAYEEATILTPGSVLAWYRLGRAWVELGQAEAAWSCVDALEQLEQGENAAAMLQTTIEVALRGEEALPEVYALADQLSDGPRSARLVARLLEGQAWLHAGLPSAAADSFKEASGLDLQHLEAAWWRAEALRRAGMLYEAEDVVGRQVLRADEAALGASVRARLLVDLGDLEGARAELEPFAGVASVDLLEAGWYLERAAGRPDRAAAIEPLWRSLVQDPHRSLEDLVIAP